MGDRWFSDEELHEMSRPTMDRAIEAIDRGDLDQARALCEAMKYEWRRLVAIISRRSSRSSPIVAHFTKFAASTKRCITQSTSDLINSDPA